jgi:hypothetical protein
VGGEGLAVLGAEGNADDVNVAAGLGQPGRSLGVVDWLPLANFASAPTGVTWEDWPLALA